MEGLQPPDRERPVLTPRNAAAEDDRSPAALREGVRRGIADALEREIDRRSTSTAVRLGLAGGGGIAVTLCALLCFAGRSSGMHSPWHLAVCGTLWAGLLVASLGAIALRVQPKTVPLRQTAEVGVIGLLLAALMGAACPEPGYLAWWLGTGLGAASAAVAGESGGALLLGLGAALAVGFGASLLVSLRLPGMRGSLLPALHLFVLLWPGLLLQSHGYPASVLLAWSVGTILGAAAGIRAGIASASLLLRPAY